MRVLREDSIALVILDVMMPEIDGFEVMRFIREEQGMQALPVVVLTACSSNDDIAKAMALGADKYVTKPFNVVELVHDVERLLGHRRAA
jgi:DNA-binding response OmpR family regulator